MNDGRKYGAGLTEAQRLTRVEQLLGSGGGGGVSDHGALAGLGDDDHAQYHNDARGDARYSLLAHTHAGTYQPLDTDLTTLAGLVATTDNFIQSKAGAWASRTVAQVVADLVTGGLLTAATAASTYQPLDADLTTLAGLTATTDNVIQSKAGAWASRTLAQFIVDLQTAGLAPKASPTFTGTVVIPAAAGSTSPYQKGEVDTLLATKQASDTDLTTIAGLTATTDNFMQAKGSAWASRTVAQVVTDLTAGGLAPIASPVFTGTPTVPTAAEGAASLTAASTAYVDRAVGSVNMARPAASAGLSVDTAHANNSLNLVTWTVEDFDTDGMYSTSSNPSRMYAMTTGTFNLSACISFNNNAAGGRYVNIRKNSGGSSAGGTSVGYVSNEEASTNFFSECVVAKNIQLTAGDYLEVFAYQNSGGSLNIRAGHSYLTLAWVGGTGAAWGNADGHIYGTSNQSIANNTETVITMAALTTDSSGMTRSGNQLVCTVPGKYKFKGSVFFDSNATGLRYCFVRKNGSTMIHEYPTRTANASPYGTTVHVETPAVAMVTGDYVELVGWQNSGGALNAMAGAYSTYLSGFRTGYQTNPQKDGQQVTGGRVICTSTYTSASLAAGANSADLCTALTLTGDGVNAMLLELTGYGAYISAGTAGHFYVNIWDGTIGTSLQGSHQFYIGATGQGNGYIVRAYIPPFTGSKTFRAALMSGATSQTLSNQAGATSPTIFTAKWLPPA